MPNLTESDINYADYLSTWTQIKDVHFWDAAGTLSKLLESIKMSEKLNIMIQREIIDMIQYARYEAFLDGKTA